MTVQELVDDTIAGTPMAFVKEHSTFHEEFNTGGRYRTSALLHWCKDFGNRKIDSITLKNGKLWIVIC